MLQETPQQRLRRDALKRTTSYSHPPILLASTPIDAKDCQQLHQHLTQLLQPKLEQVRLEATSTLSLQDLERRYEQSYNEFGQLTTAKDIQQQAACQVIKELHETSEILMNPPPLNPKGDVYLYFRDPPSLSEAEQIQMVFRKYQQSYKQNRQQGQDQAEKAITKAKAFLLS